VLVCTAPAPVSGAYRIYDDPDDLLRHLDEIGVRLDSRRGD